MENIILGILGGGFATALNWILLHSAALPIFRGSFRRLRNKSRPKAFARLIRIFSPSHNHRLLGTFLAATSIPALAIWAILFPSTLAIGIGVPAFMGSMAAIWYTLGKKDVAKMRAKIALAGIELYTENKDTSELPALLTHAAKHPDPAVRLCAMEGLGHWAAEDALPLLEVATTDPDPLVKEAALKNQALVLRLTGKTRLYGVEIVEELLRYIQELTEKEFKFGSKRGYQFMEKRLRVEDTLHKILNTHKHLRNAYPHLFCVNCKTRTELRKQENWEYLSCRNCSDINGIISGVEKVVGTIGGNKNWNQQGTTLYFSLWDQEKKKARFADVDELMVIGNQEMNYDWAINAVLEVLRNGAIESDFRLPVTFQHRPELTNNTEMLISQIQPQTPQITP